MLWDRARYSQRLTVTNYSTVRKSIHAFTLAELLVGIAVLTLLTLLIARIVNSAATITTLSGKHMDADAQARPLLDRMAIDFAQMVKRSDVQCYLKSPIIPMTGTTASTNNDRIAFYSTVPGDYPSTGSQSPFSLVAYRVNSSTAAANTASNTRLQRMSRGLLMNGDSSSITDGPIVFGPTAIELIWPSIGSNATFDAKYELVGPQVFRFEYYYLLTNGNLSATPWDTALGHIDATGMRDVAAIVVTIATIDSRSRVLLDNARVATIAGALPDYGSGAGPGQLLAQWRDKLNADAQITAMPRPAIAGIRFYERYFYLAPTRQ
jgi:hypothetical protein